VSAVVSATLPKSIEVLRIVAHTFLGGGADADIISRLETLRIRYPCLIYALVKFSDDTVVWEFQSAPIRLVDRFAGFYFRPETDMEVEKWC
jgi:hypothetical protein